MGQPSTTTEERAFLPGDLDRRLAAAMPRLARLAGLRGVPADTVDDVVQQTLIEAWRAVDRLRTPASFDAWLDGICRNLCRRYQRAEGAREALPLSSLAHADDAPIDVADEDALDLDEALDAEDRARLLDRALGHLPVSTRGAVEACYLADLPTGEAALRLGLSVNALEVRLHRARQQLRQLLNGPLREEAASLGLRLSSEESEGWRETREWCLLCGARRLRGVLEPQPDGTTRLRMRCPDCSPKYEVDVEQSHGLPELTGVSSFRPAIRRYRTSLVALYQNLCASEWRHCPRCGGEVHLRPAPPDDVESFGSHWYAIIACARCGTMRASWPGVAVWGATGGADLTQTWLHSHTRSLLEPDTLTTYRGVLAVRSRYVDVATGQAVVIFSDPQVPRLFGIHEE